MQITTIKGKVMLCPKCKSSDLEVVDHDYVGVIAVCSDHQCRAYAGYQEGANQWHSVMDNQTNALQAAAVIGMAVLAAVAVWVYLLT